MKRKKMIGMLNETYKNTLLILKYIFYFFAYFMITNLLFMDGKV